MSAELVRIPVTDTADLMGLHDDGKKNAWLDANTCTSTNDAGAA